MIVHEIFLIRHSILKKRRKIFLADRAGKSRRHALCRGLPTAALRRPQVSSGFTEETFGRQSVGSNWRAGSVSDRRPPVADAPGSPVAADALPTEGLLCEPGGDLRSPECRGRETAAQRVAATFPCPIGQKDFPTFFQN